LKHCFRKEHATTSTKLVSPRLSTIIAWLENYFDDVCDKMPTKDEYYLPCFIFWNNIREELNKFLAENEDYISVSLFYFSVVMYHLLILFKTIQIRREYFSKVKAPKYTKQEKCDKCLELKEKREKAVSNAE
jgi:hypothetical protein